MRRLSFLILLIAIWTVGLFAFAGRVEQQQGVESPPVSDAVAVLTGASTLRLKAGIALLEAGKGRRLLVSGVNEKVKREDLLEVTGAWKPIYQCCVDLGFEAANTKGNAAEIAAWAATHRFRQVIIVTADYHMPRALLELRSRMPGAVLIPYPVRTEAVDAARWWRNDVQIRRMTLEYCKYLAVLAQESAKSIFRADATPVAKPKDPAA